MHTYSKRIMFFPPTFYSFIYVGIQGKMFKDLGGCHNFFISVYTFGMTVKNI